MQPPADITRGINGSGHVLGVRDCGPLVIVYVATEDGRILYVPLAHEALQRLLELEDCGADDLVGRLVRVEVGCLEFLEEGRCRG